MVFGPAGATWVISREKREGFWRCGLIQINLSAGLVDAIRIGFKRFKGGMRIASCETVALDARNRSGTVP